MIRGAERKYDMLRKSNNEIFRSEQGRKLIFEEYNRLLAMLDFPYEERMIDTSFGSTYVLETGDKNAPPLFLFHGSTSNSAAWFADMKELGRYFRVLSVDLIGDAGHSEPVRLDMMGDAYAYWIQELFEKTGIERASIMGNSLGAWMSLKFATVYPEKVRSLVLLAASGIAPVRAAFILRLLVYSMSGGKGADKITKMVYGKDEIPEEVKSFIRVVSENYNPYTGKIPVITDERMRRLVMPILYIAGEEDQLTNAPGCKKRLERLLPHTRIVVKPNTGHVIFAVLDEVIPFLREESGKGAFSMIPGRIPEA
jgi:pimeloyl-ACP methyl ester carboxylesterase